MTSDTAVALRENIAKIDALRSEAAAERQRGADAGVKCIFSS